MSCCRWVAEAFNRVYLNILTSQQILHRLPIALAQVKADDKSENLLNEILRIMYTLYQAKEIFKKCIII